MLVIASLICFLILRSDYVTVGVAAAAAGSCAVTDPDLTLNPILAAGAMDFSVNLYNALKNGTTNLFFSPFSVRVALAMTAVGAVGTTLVQMIQALQLHGFTSQSPINQAFQGYLGSFCPNNNYKLSTANRIYLRDGFPISPTFTQALSAFYLSSAASVNFGADPNGVASTINNWVAQQTNNTIRDLFSPNSFSADTVLVLVNVIYFKGTWEIPFKAADTVDGIFTLASGRNIKVPIMHLTSSFSYYASSALQSQVLQLNYAGNRLVMHIVLPAEGVSLSTVQQSLNSQNINDVINNYSSQKVIVSLPKFKANFKQELNAALKSLGMVNAFDGRAANLSGIAPSTSNGNLYVSSVIHQAYVAVNEVGTEAAAATGISLFPLSMIVNPPQPVVFDVNRPCIYFISDLQFSQILFMGILDDPSISS